MYSWENTWAVWYKWLARGFPLSCPGVDSSAASPTSCSLLVRYFLISWVHFIGADLSMWSPAPEQGKSTHCYYHTAPQHLSWKRMDSLSWASTRQCFTLKGTVHTKDEDHIAMYSAPCGWKGRWTFVGDLGALRRNNVAADPLQKGAR